MSSSVSSQGSCPVPLPVSPSDSRAPLSVTARRWQGAFAHPEVDLTTQLLTLRQISDQDSFLRPTLQKLMADPCLIPDIDTAAERLAQAIQQHQSVGILADFDVDGASSAALLFRYCQWFDVRPIVDVPDRLHEGFGPNARILDDAVARQCHVLLCLDCGTAAAEILNPYQHQLDIIIVDHHQPESILPQVLALVNPQCCPTAQKYFGDLAAVGVVFMLLVATNGCLRARGTDVPDLKALLDLVALGTVCDMVPLRGLNRAFVHRGLECMLAHPHPGLGALLQGSAIKASEVSAEDLSFRFGPRLNAGSRQGFSTLAWQLLSTDKADMAKKLSARLNSLNNQRKMESVALASEAEANLEQGQGFVVAAGHDWPIGILGILAGRLSRRLQQPCFVISYEQDIGHGSARSIPGVSLAALLQQATTQGILVRGGGHEMAGGFVLKRENHQQFVDFLTQQIALLPIAEPCLNVEFATTIAALSPAILAQLRRLEPFGTGNPEPLFLLPKVRLRQVKLMGSEHLRAQVIDDSYRTVNAVLFSEAQSLLGEFLRTHSGIMDIVVRLKPDFRYRQALSVHIEDARMCL